MDKDPFPLTESQVRRLYIRYRKAVRAATDMRFPCGPTSRKRAARKAACIAERLGMIERPEHCEWCRGRVRLYRHHWDLRKPTFVVYLCQGCHAIADDMVREDGKRGNNGDRHT